MIRHYKPTEKSKEDGIRFGSSDPTPALPEREGAGNYTNESEVAHTPMVSEREGAGNHTNESDTVSTPMVSEREEAENHTNESFTIGIKDSQIISE